MKPVDLSVVIPTLNRDQVLVDTIQHLLGLKTRASEIIIVDQSASHTKEVEEALRRWHEQNEINLVRVAQPSIPSAMNLGLKRARSQYVLFLDDDIQPIGEIVEDHLRALQDFPERWATVGQVIQPWEQSAEVVAPRKLVGLREDFDFPFCSTIPGPVVNVMAGNLCVNRELALSIGAFDSNFQGAAYRFETEFAKRIIKNAGKIWFLGCGGILHLRVASGGTRTAGSHLTSPSPLHGIGDYYYAFLHGNRWERWRYSMRRLVREVTTKFHAKHPWWIPVKLLGEVRALIAGRKLARETRNRKSESDR